MQSDRKICLLTYADVNYQRQQQSLEQVATASKAFDSVMNWSRERFILWFPDFYERYKHILDQPRGGGYWLWKPHLLYETIKLMNEGDLLLYMDCGDKLAKTDGLRERLIDLMADKDVYLTAGAFKNSDWTKGDCFKIMNCDEPKYHDAIQLEAGIVLVKASPKALSVMWEWRYHCLFTQALTDEPNYMGPNLEGFKDHRHDQSILTNLQVKYNLPSGDALREFIYCNQNA